jgi:hypothetical protein
MDYTARDLSDPAQEMITMTIQIELLDGTVCRVVPQSLDILLSHRRVRRFRRNNCWVLVGRDPIRTRPENPDYSGPERRILN